MKHPLPWLLSVSFFILAGCASQSKIIEPERFPPGKYGLYETDSKALVGTWDIGPDQTFGYEYQDKTLVATTIERLKGPRGDEKYEVEQRIPLNPKRHYEWRSMAKPAAVTKPS
jgi:hypothetical protein